MCASVRPHYFLTPRAGVTGNEINVVVFPFIISALTVTLFFGGWNAPFPWPWAVTLNLDPGGLGIGLLLLVAIVPLVLTLAFAAPIWMSVSVGNAFGAASPHPSTPSSSVR